MRSLFLHALDLFRDVLVVSIPKLSRGPMTLVGYDMSEGGPISIARDAEGTDYHFLPGGPILGGGATVTLRDEAARRNIVMRRIGTSIELELHAHVEPVVPGAPDTDLVEKVMLSPSRGKSLPTPPHWEIYGQIGREQMRHFRTFRKTFA